MRNVGRNEDCPCGSGKRFKHCCGNRIWIFDHPDLRELKDVRAPDLEAARAVFESWWNGEIVAGRLGARRPFTEGRVYEQTDKKAESYVKLERRGEGYVCSGPCRDFTFRYVFKGSRDAHGVLRKDAYCVPCFLKLNGAPEELQKDPERVRGFSYNEDGKLVLDLVDEEAPGAEQSFEPPREWRPDDPE